ncbi:MAG TPA: alpha-L-fucosidase [Chthonomonadaceae bacterium]|nr:alpha-L-fucosidase [Chthonomonadaceae bacterium]
MENIAQGIAAGPFQANWESLKGYAIPAWYLDGKFGIFIHWGVYAVPGFGSEWYPRQMYQQGTKEFDHHVATYGPQTEFGYKDFIPQFKAEHYDPDHWAALFKAAGAKFVVPVAEHHDGFPMYDSDLTDWCAAKMGPKRDLIGDLAEAVRKQGLVVGASSHRAEHWWFFDGGRAFPSDVQDPTYDGLYGPAQPGPKDSHDRQSVERPDKAFLDDWLARTCELVDKYRPQLIWFDWWIGHEAFAPYLQQFAAYYYNRGAEWGEGVAINYKYEAFPEGTAVFDVERGQLAGIRPQFWQNDTSLSKNSWGYVHHQDYKTATSLIGDLVDIVSKNGALLLNIGPRPDGTIPEPEERLLREIGEWLAINGEAIYGTRPWKLFGEGPTEISEGAFTDTKRQEFTPQDIRFTVKEGALYATLLAWPGNGHSVTIEALRLGSPYVRGEIGNVHLLGHKARLVWQQTAEGLRIEVPTRRNLRHAYVLKITGLELT